MRSRAARSLRQARSGRSWRVEHTDRVPFVARLTAEVLVSEADAADRLRQRGHHPSRLLDPEHRRRRIRYLAFLLGCGGNEIVGQLADSPACGDSSGLRAPVGVAASDRGRAGLRRAGRGPAGQLPADSPYWHCRMSNRRTAQLTKRFAHEKGHAADGFASKGDAGRIEEKALAERH